MAAVRAVRVERILAPEAPPGSFTFWCASESGGEPDGLHFNCPCGCGQVGAVRFASQDRPGWAWDGNRECPTIAPSVLFQPDCNGGGHWHGFLRAGIWESC